MLRVKNWNEFQHYKDRAPAWIKLHKNLLDDFAFQRLPLASRALAPMLWLLASESKDGTFTTDVDEIAFRLRWSPDEISAGLKPLIDGGFILSDSTVLAERYHDAIPEKEREKEKRKRESIARKRATRLEEDWELPEDWLRYGLDGGLMKAECEQLAFEMKSWSLTSGGQKGVSKDWKRTWQTWCRRHKGWGKRTMLDEKPRLSIQMPDEPEASERYARLVRRLGEDVCASWFQPPPRKNGAGWVVDGSGVKRDKIEQRFAHHLNEVYSEWRFG